MKKISANLIKSLLNFELDVCVYDEVTSTNDVAKTISQGVVFAARQTAGRGRMERKFFSGEGGLYFSLSLPLKGRIISIGGTNVPFSPGRLTISAGIAVCKTLKFYGYDAKIKWVNDIYVDGKKVCGILAEGVGDKAILGIGVNLASNIPDFLSEKAASLDLDCDFNEVAAAIINGIKDELLSPDIAFLNAHCITIGKTVMTKDGVGKAVGVDDSGGLLVSFDGKIKEVYLGEAEICRV